MKLKKICKYLVWSTSIKVMDINDDLIAKGYVGGTKDLMNKLEPYMDAKVMLIAVADMCLVVKVDAVKSEGGNE